jgi:hypothetical protein
MNQSRRAESARRRSFVMLGPASAAYCETVLAQMKRFCASRSTTGTSARAPTASPGARHVEVLAEAVDADDLVVDRERGG